LKGEAGLKAGASGLKGGASGLKEVILLALAKGLSDKVFGF
jgi:hypothetical protein